ncbi:hypothetical protein ABFX02_12G059950 [Erythranthe guttata]
MPIRFCGRSGSDNIAQNGAQPMTTKWMPYNSHIFIQLHLPLNSPLEVQLNCYCYDFIFVLGFKLMDFKSFKKREEKKLSCVLMIRGAPKLGIIHVFTYYELMILFQL